MDVQSRTNTHRSLTRFLGLFSAASFILNWPWEMLQMPAYVEMAGRSWGETALTCTIATFGDVGLSLAIYGVAALAAGRVRWGIAGGWNVYLAAAVLGAMSATAIELWALANERWTYSPAMPLLPLAGVGLWPFLQLTILVPLALWIARRVAEHDKCG